MEQESEAEIKEPLGAVNWPEGPIDPDLGQELIEAEKSNKKGKRNAGILLVLLGFVCFLLGIQGHLTWSFKIFGIENNLVDAAPGFVLSVSGFFLIMKSDLEIGKTRK